MMEGISVENIGNEEVAQFEHRFWLQIMGDHARFIFHALSPNETEALRRSQAYMSAFDQLLQQARGAWSPGGEASFSRQAQQEVTEFRRFKLELLRRHLVGNISIGISETFLNHMVNELDEYLRLLNYFVQDQIPPKPIRCIITFYGLRTPPPMRVF